MTNTTKLFSCGAIAIAAATLSSVALAGVVAPAPVPEPGVFGIVALGTTAVIIAMRLRKRK